jgi:hypothetical protein
MMTLTQIKTALRNGPYAWPGGYPLYFVCTNGEAISFNAVRDNWRFVVEDNKYMNPPCLGWAFAGVEINWEDAELVCAVTSARIPSAYGEEEQA